MPGTNSRIPNQYIRRFLFMAAVLLLSAPILQAQAAPPVAIPESVVLVLKLVSATRVKPTTGVVISNNGLVLVSADFVSGGGEIVVLDGGTDIIRNGRPSRLLQLFAADGLAILAVAGLSRPRIILSADEQLQEQVFHLAAFPPAEKIAQGAEPLWVPARLTKRDSGDGFDLSAATPLPNTTGPIVDDCGYLVGLNLAAGGQSPAANSGAVTIFGQDLDRVLRSLQIDLQRGVCRQPTRPAEQNKALEELAEKGDLAGPDEQTGKNGDTEPVSALNAEPIAEQTPEVLPTRYPNGAGQDAATAPPPAVVTGRPPLVTGLIPNWLWLAGAAILVILLIKLVFLRSGKNHPQSGDPQQAVDGDHQFPAEPATAPLGADTGSLPRNAGPEPSAEDIVPAVNDLPEGFDGIVIVEGLPGDGVGFKRFCLVNMKHIDVVIGRGDADIDIALPAISRNHVRLAMHAERLTISDLGSRHGTFVRGIPCLAGEIMFIDPEDEILLGDVHIRINLLTRHGEPQ